MHAACGGDVDSFRQLYERHYCLAVAVARSRLSELHLAEDAAQEAFAEACRRLATLRNGDRFPQWLGTICRRTAGRMARWQPSANGKPVQSDPPAPESSSDARVARMHEAIERLPTTARELVTMHYFSGLTYDEIGRTLNISPQAVHGRLQRARRTLAGWLTKED